MNTSIPSREEEELEAAGSGERALLRSLDYPCTRRLCFRRLLAYHRRYTNQTIYDEMKVRTTLIFHVKDMMLFLKRGEWREASDYILDFLDHDQQSHEARRLLRFLTDLMAFDDFAHGHIGVACAMAQCFLRIFREPVLGNYPYLATLVVDVLFLRSDHANDFVNWELVRKKAAEIAKEIVSKTPELRNKLLPPRGPKNLYHVVPIWSSSRRVCQGKNVSPNKQAGELAQFYLQMKNRLPSSESQEASDNSSVTGTAAIMLMELLDKTFKAGTRLMLEQGCIPEYCSQCFPLIEMASRPLFDSKFLQSQVHQPGLKKSHEVKGLSGQ